MDRGQVSDRIKGNGNPPPGPCKSGKRNHDWRLKTERLKGDRMNRFYECVAKDAAFVTVEPKGR
jgi:hypothetical protein